MTGQYFTTKAIILNLQSLKFLEHFSLIQMASCISRSWIISALNSLQSQQLSQCLAWTPSVQVREYIFYFSISILFKIFSSKGIISLNVSLRDPPEQIHLHLQEKNIFGSFLKIFFFLRSEMPIYSPVFYLCDRVFTLTLLLHDRDYFHQVRIKLIQRMFFYK